MLTLPTAASTAAEFVVDRTDAPRPFGHARGAAAGATPAPTVVVTDHPIGLGLSVSPDQRFLVFAQHDKRDAI
jgi:hypothetical protein